ncbi:MAG TPA: polysaccharide biosynthesis tyrosine autokinase [Thermoanaerobaculia bacterium]|nr:polysaccharide biosynthesis tyrosine autokinase [Thermoanaerobaculia bacterium]
MAEHLDSFEETASESGATETNLAQYWEIVVRRRRLIIACLLIAIAAGVIVTMMTKPAYQATAVVDIERQHSSPVNFDREGYGGGDPEFLPSQTQLMQSREIAERVVKRLNLLADKDFNPKRWQRYRPDAKGKVPVPTEEALVGAALDVQGRIDATIIRGTNLVEVTVTAPTAKLAAAMANSVAESYEEWNGESRFKAIGQSARFLAAQIDQAKSEVDAKEKELLAYGQRRDMLASSDATVNPAAQRLESTSRDLGAATTDRIVKEARYQELRNMPNDSIGEGVGAAAVLQIKSDLQKLEREYQDKLAIYKPELPAMKQLQKQIDNTRENLASSSKDAAAKAVENARTDYMSALRREQSLEAAAKSQRNDAFAAGTETVEYKNLRVEIDTKRALLDNLLRQQGETEVVSRLRDDQTALARIVDRALPPGKPFKPSYQKNLVIFLFLGSVLGIGLAFVMSYLDRSLRTPEQVEQLLQLPALGVIPSVEHVAGAVSGLRRGLLAGRRADTGKRATSIEFLPHEEPRSPISEAYRAFRTALLLSRAGGVKSVVVTSSFPQEGKSATAVNLAIVLGQLGKRVLLVDADLHKSRIHELFEIPNRVGLVSILAENLEPSRAIVKTAYPGVFVVPAGPETPNPSALLSSDAMRKFMELAGTNFDHVVVDTPPVLLVSDTLVFAQQTDGAVLCVHGGETPREQVKRAQERIMRSGVPVLGVLINKLEPERGHYYRPYAYEYGAEKPAETVESEASATTAARAAQPT